MDKFYQIIAETMTAQSYEVDTTVAGRLLAGNDIRRYILAEAASALDHHVPTDVAELMAKDFGTDDGKVITADFTGELGGIANDQAVAKESVMGYMHVFHQQVIAAYSCRSFGSCATGNGYVLTDAVVVTYFAYCFLAFEFQILGLRGDACTREKLVVVANAGAIIDGDTILQYVVVAEHSILVNVAERADDVVVT